MRFNPHIKVVRDEQAELAADFELPDDLELLGQQLSDDAAHLASLYPASPFATSPLSVALSQESFARSLKTATADDAVMASVPVQTVSITSRRAGAWRWLGGLATLATGLAVLVMVSPWLATGTQDDVATDSVTNSSIAIAPTATTNQVGSTSAAHKSEAASQGVVSPADTNLTDRHLAETPAGNNRPNIVGLKPKTQGSSADSASFTNSVLLKNVTGPELEGMLDLLEHDTPDQPGVSLEL